MTSPTVAGSAQAGAGVPPVVDSDAGAAEAPKAKKSRTNTPWTPAEELRLKQMRDTGNSWSEIAKVQNLSFAGKGMSQSRQHLLMLQIARPSHNEQKEV